MTMAGPTEVSYIKDLETENRRNNLTSKEVVSEQDLLVSRAKTMLREATMLRDGYKPSSTTRTIAGTVKTLHREKTTMESKHMRATVIDDDDTVRFLTELKKPKTKDVMTDSDFDTDLEEDFESKSESSVQTKPELYEQTCRKLGVRAMPSIRDALAHGCDVIAPHRLLNALDMLCLTNALVNNNTVTKLVLDGNSVGDAGAQCLAWLIRDHGCYLQTASLCDNGIGAEGFEAIGEMLETNRTIKFLNLSGNRAEDQSIEKLAASLKENRQLQYLNLSHNTIGDEGARFIASALAVNDGLQTLDLSWNKIRPPGGVALFASLKENITLKSLQLAMNGLGTPGAMFVGDLLRQNETLTYINITFNRIFDEGAAHIAKGLEKNEALHHLIIHNNPVTTISAMALLNGINKNQNSAMWKLDMCTVAVVQEAVTLADEINHRMGDFEFRYKGLVNCEVSMIGSVSHTLDARNPLAMVKEYIENEGLRLVDFFKQMDKDKSGTISRDEFVEGLTNANVLLSQHQMDKLMESLDENGDGEIDYSELIEGDKEYRRKRRQRRMKELQLIQGHVTDYFGYESKT